MSSEQCLLNPRHQTSDFVKDEDGTTVIEYGLIAGFITFAIITLLASLGDSLNIAFTGVNSDLETTIDSMNQ